MTADAVGGVWSHALELSRALSRQGVDVVLAVLGPRPSEAQERQARAVPGLSLRSASFKLPWMEDPWDDVARAGDHLLALADAVEPDLVHLSEPVFASLPWAVPTVAVGHSCVLSWYEAVRGEPAPATWDRYRMAMRTGLAAADMVVTPSRTMLAALRRHYGVRDGTVVPNGSDANRYQRRAKEPIVLTAGRLWDPAKNVATLAALAPELAWPVHAAGIISAPDGRALPLAGSIRLLGALDAGAMADAMARAAIYALPARYEPFGLSALEAALAGCALVLGDIPSLRELWDGAACFVGPDDRAGLRVAIAALISEPARRQALARRARRRALNYSLEGMAQGYLSVYARASAARDLTTLLPGSRACAS
jgi:glycogen(starch) synthase